MGRIDTTIFIIAIATAAALLIGSDLPFVPGLLVAIASFTIIWIASLAVNDAGIVDIFWGPGFVVVGAFYAYGLGAAPGPRAWLVLALVTLWSVRLAAHIGRRNAGAGEDFRYRKWREETGSAFWWISYFKIFLLQAVVLWVVSSPLLLAHDREGGGSLAVTDLFGLALFATGFLVEAVADRQLARFKSDPANRGAIMRTGLWARSRHPNYFGEAVLWWGIGLLALPTGGWMALVGPALLTFLLLRVSGVAMLDAGLTKRRPGYAEYMATTPAFVPRLRRPVTTRGRA